MARPDNSESAWVRAGRFAAVGLEFGATVSAGVILGYHLDQWLGTAPLFTLVVALAALGGALYRLAWLLQRFR